MSHDIALLKDAIRRTFPSDRRDVLYIYDFFGRVLFPDWDMNVIVRPFDATEKRFWSGVWGYHDMMQSSPYTEAQKSECVNFIFVESMRRLDRGSFDTAFQ